MKPTDQTLPVAPPRLHPVSLLVGLILMLAGSLYPPLMASADGRADHRLLLLLLWAMSAGFVHGVGFQPRTRLWRLVFSATAMWLALAAALLYRLS